MHSVRWRCEGTSYVPITHPAKDVNTVNNTLSVHDICGEETENPFEDLKDSDYESGSGGGSQDDDQEYNSEDDCLDDDLVAQIAGCESERLFVTTREQLHDVEAGITAVEGHSKEPDDKELMDLQHEMGDRIKLEIEGLDLRKCTLSKARKTRLIQLLNSYKDVFSANKEPGLVTDVEFKIDTGDAKPVKSKARYLNPAKFKALRAILDKMINDGIIRPSNSPWSSAIVMVPKDGGAEWRLCIDYRKLNAVTRGDAYPLPKMSDLITCYKDAEVFSSLDLTAGYWQIPVAPEDVEKTAFICPLGLFEFVRMPFGAK